MRLHAAATHFNHMVCYDAYTGVKLFKSQLTAFDDSRRDSEGGERRIIELAPGTSIPTRRVIEAEGTRYIVGHPFGDSMFGKPIRIKYVAHEATGLASLQTLAQVCTTTAGTLAYGARAWIKDSKEIDESSQMIGVNHLHFSTAETIPVNTIITFDGTRHIVRKTMKGSAGTLIATCDEIPDPSVQTAVLKSGTYDPVTDTTTTTNTTLTVLRLRWQSLFEYRDTLAPTFQPEDLQVVIAKSVATPKVGATISLSDGDANITSILDRDGVWICRVARHG